MLQAGGDTGDVTKKLLQLQGCYRVDISVGPLRGDIGNLHCNVPVMFLY